jgi:hypothetical protein
MTFQGHQSSIKYFDSLSTSAIPEDHFLIISQPSFKEIDDRETDKSVSLEPMYTSTCSQEGVVCLDTATMRESVRENAGTTSGRAVRA